MKSSLLKLTVLLFSILFISTSCSKDDDPAPVPAAPVTYDIKGYYKGTFGNSSSMVLLLEDGGKFTLGDGALIHGNAAGNIGYGTGYTVTGNVVSGTFKMNVGAGQQYSFSATYNPETGALTGGTIGLGTSVSGHSTFTAQRTINANSNLVGLWYGKYNSTPSNTTTFGSPYTMLIEDATHVVVADGASISGMGSLAYGTYTLAGTAFTATYKYSFGTGSQFTNLATFNTTDAKLNPGSWGSGLSTSGGGNWYMDKRP